jgi:hypothetical protein
MKAILTPNALDTMRIHANANANETMLQLPTQDMSSKLLTVISTSLSPMFRCLMNEKKINFFFSKCPSRPARRVLNFVSRSFIVPRSSRFGISEMLMVRQEVSP